MSKDINKYLKEHPVSCSRGAPMGAMNRNDSDQPLHLQALDMVDGAYDKSGVYWGCWSREYGGVYCAFSEDMETLIYVRAHSLGEAAMAVLHNHEVKFKQNT